LTGTYFKKSKKEEKQKILKKELLKNLQDAKAGSGHKKNKSDSNLKRHVKNFSLFEDKPPGNSESQVEMAKLQHGKKTSKIYQKDGDSFFEFQDSSRGAH
jgi:hypothetical protein